jgi:hypothetical protein
MVFPLFARANVTVGKWFRKAMHRWNHAILNVEIFERDNCFATAPRNNFVILRSLMCGRCTITIDIRHNDYHYGTLSGTLTSTLMC